jgi:hypothetical protein
MNSRSFPHIVLLAAVLSVPASLAPRSALGQAASAEAEAEIEQLQIRVEQFFGSLTNSAEGPERAVRQIVGKGPLKDRNDDINKLIEQASSLDQRYGAYAGHEAASERAVGKDLIFLRYLYKGEKFPVVWYFTFYRTGANGSINREWQLISLRFDSKVEALEK